MNRRNFLSASFLGSAGLMMSPALLAGAPRSLPPGIDPAMVKDFVGVAHRDLAAVKQMHAGQPFLLNGAWDWGSGDFETAVGAAGHVGNREIAMFLIENGARADIFVLAMLGYNKMVLSLLKTFPYMLTSYGPHGFTLLHHAQQGENTALAERLQEMGLRETRYTLF